MSNAKPTSNPSQTRSSDITPPPELVQQWVTEFYSTPIAPDVATTAIATRAAQWGADQELEACCEWVDSQCDEVIGNALRADRRPNPPSLAEEAKADLDRLVNQSSFTGSFEMSQRIWRALDRLQELEDGND